MVKLLLGSDVLTKNVATEVVRELTDVVGGVLSTTGKCQFREIDGAIIAEKQRLTFFVGTEKTWSSSSSVRALVSGMKSQTRKVPITFHPASVEEKREKSVRDAGVREAAAADENEL